MFNVYYHREEIDPRQWFWGWVKLFGGSACLHVTSSWFPLQPHNHRVNSRHQGPGITQPPSKKIFSRCMKGHSLEFRHTLACEIAQGRAYSGTPAQFPWWKEADRDDGRSDLRVWKKTHQERNRTPRNYERRSRAADHSQRCPCGD